MIIYYIKIAILLIFAQANVFAQCWQLESFDSVTHIFKSHEMWVDGLLIAMDPKVAEWCVLKESKDDALWEARRRAFILRLKNKPESIKWDNPFIWAQGFLSSQEVAHLSDTDTEFNAAYLKFKKISEILYTKSAEENARNLVFHKKFDEIIKIDNVFKNRLIKLQHEIDIEYRIHSKFGGLND